MNIIFEYDSGNNIGPLVIITRQGNFGNSDLISCQESLFRKNIGDFRDVFDKDSANFLKRLLRNPELHYMFVKVKNYFLSRVRHLVY